MTYLHALQYLSGSARDTAELPEEMPRTARRESNPLYDAYCAELHQDAGNVCYLLFDSDAFGLLCASYCRAALLAAGLVVGEIADSTVGELSEVLRIDGTPLSPAYLREICHLARATEQRILRRAAKEVAAQSPDAPRPTIPPLTAAQRCGAVLLRLFAEAGCRVILLIGDTRDDRLRHMTQNAAGGAVAVLSAASHRPLQHFPTGTREVVCPTCNAAVFSKVTDACSRRGSRLTLTTTSHLTRQGVLPFSQKFSYHTLKDCTLRLGTSEALRAAMLATEALLALGRLGCPVPDAAMQHGFAQACAEHIFAPLSIQPLLITHAVHGEDDLQALIDALTEFKDALPTRRLLLCEENLPADWQTALSACGEIAPLTQEQALTAYHAEEEQTTILIGHRATLTALATALKGNIRRL